jgi:phage major head subunit gpT-like protein
MTVLRANVADLLNEQFYKIAFNEFNRHAEQYSQIFNVKTSGKNDEHVSAISGLPIAPTKTEGADMTYYDPIQLYDGTYTHTTYSMGVRLTWESMDDDQYGILGQRLFSSMGNGFKQRVETAGAGVFINGFQASGYDGPDSVPLFSVSHPRNPDEASTVHANKPATDADLTVSSLKAGITNFEKTKDERGLNIQLRPRKLLIPVDLDFTADEILQSALEPYIAENTKNVLAGRGLGKVVNHYLTDPDAWFLLADKGDHTLLPD